MHAPPPRFLRRRRTIDFAGVWFLQVQLLLPVEAGRSEPVQLHVSALTAALCSTELEHYLSSAATV
jgi:hypothetical protein